MNMKKIKNLIVLVVISGLSSCAARPMKPSVSERIYRHVHQSFVGSGFTLDLTMEQADGHYCYSDEDTRKIKKYIVDLENRLTGCE